MSYLVLARKFRPQSFAAIRGQDYITKAISNAIIRDRVPHAFLFCGPRGVGKTSTARVLAKALNCTGRAVPSEEELRADPQAWLKLEPCGECANCKEITRSISFAVWEIDGASNNGVDNVRELIDSLRSSPPPGSKYKIYIVDEVHMLSTAAFNALLKSLEEPPPNTIFIFATTEPQKIPETVISRCQRHDFSRLSIEAIEQQLQAIADQEQVEVEPDVLTFVARKAQGGMRDAQSMFDRLLSSFSHKLSLQEAQKVFGALDAEFFFALSQAVFAKDAFLVFKLLDRAFSESINLRYFVDDFLRHWRNLLLISNAGTRSESLDGLRKILELTEEELRSYCELIGKSKAFHIQRLFDLAQKLADTALRSSYPRYIFEAGLSKMCALEDLRPMGEILDLLKNFDEGKAKEFFPSGVLPPRPSFVAKESEEQKKNLKETQSKLSQNLKAPEFAADVIGEEKHGFSPSWETFIRYVQSSSEPVLATFLKRASAKNFDLGRLDLLAGSFDLAALRDGSSKDALLRCLVAYSGFKDWKLNFLETSSELRSTGPVPDSLLDQEKKQRSAHRASVEEEARNQEATKAVLAVFEGAAIEKIAVDKVAVE